MDTIYAELNDAYVKAQTQGDDIAEEIRKDMERRAKMLNEMVNR